MQKYVIQSNIVKGFQWDGFMQTLLNNLPQNCLLRDFEYDNDSLFVNTQNGYQHCPIGYYVINNTQDYIILSPTQFKSQYKKMCK